MKIGDTLLAVATAIIGVAVVAALVSNRSRTPEVITSTGSAFTQILNAALSPVMS
jgi:hypothetical protein